MRAVLYQFARMLQAFRQCIAEQDTKNAHFENMHPLLEACIRTA